MFSDHQSQYDNNSNNFSPQIRGIQSLSSPLYDRSLIPTTVKKILSEASPEPDSPFRIDGMPVHQVSIIGKLLHIQHQSTHTLFIVDDQGCKIKCKLWSSDNDDLLKLRHSQIKTGDLVKLIGKIDIFKSDRSLNIHHMEKIKDFNQVYYHGLEAIFAHELNTVLVNQHILDCKHTFDAFIHHSIQEQQQRNQEIQQYRQQQQQQQLSAQNNYHQNHNYQQSPNRFVQQPQQQRNHNYNHNNNNNNNMNNYNNRPNRFMQGHYNDDQGSNDSLEDKKKKMLMMEKTLNPLETKILKWLRFNYDSNDMIGHSSEQIEKGVGCYDRQRAQQAIKKLYDESFIQDTMPNHYQLVLAETE